MAFDPSPATWRTPKIPPFDPLGNVHSEALFYTLSTCSGDWGIGLPPMDASLMVHHIIEGSAVVQMANGTSVTLERNDIAFIPYCSGHRIGSSGTSPCPSIFSLERQLKGDRFETLTIGHPPHETTLICAALSFDQPMVQRLLRSMASVVHMKADDENSHSKIPALLGLIRAEVETQQWGSEIILNRLSDLLALHGIRHWMESKHDGKSTWLSAMFHERLAPVVGAIHRAPHKPWSVEIMAKDVALSRSQFAQLFRRVTGETPGKYLEAVRMEKAAIIARDGTHTVSQLAEAVGYESESAFSRAYKRYFGISPSRHRQEDLHNT